MGEGVNDDVVEALQTIIEKFGDDMAPYAIKIVYQLAKAFMTYSKGDDDDDDDESSMAAAQ